MPGKNASVTLDVTDLNNLGFGVAHMDGMTVFVSGAVDGERVRARILTVKKTYAVAKAEEILTPSPHRITPACTARGCGGCAYRQISYAHEREVKRDIVRAAFRRAGVEATVGEVRTPQTPDGKALTCHYRNKAQYPVAAAPDGGYRIGFYGAKTHRVAEAAECPLQPESFAAVVQTLRAFFEKRRIPAYDEETHTGLLRHIYLRQAWESGEILVTLVVNGEELPCESELIETLRNAHPAIIGILLNTNTEDTNVICGETYRTLWGRAYLTDVLAGVRLRIAPSAFYQVNHAAAELLYAKAKELACLTGREQVLDLYCGCGSIGLSMARAAREVVGVEIEPSAVECARQNAADNGIENARFYCGDAGDPGRLLDAAVADMKLSPDVVILDPPRKGSTPELLASLAAHAVKRIVYISCNPETLARDARILLSHGYRMGEVTPFDLFPRTGHVEAVTYFVPQAASDCITGNA